MALKGKYENSLTVSICNFEKITLPRCVAVKNCSLVQHGHHLGVHCPKMLSSLLLDVFLCIFSSYVASV